LIAKSAGLCTTDGGHLEFPDSSDYVVCTLPKVICGNDQYGEEYQEPSSPDGIKELRSEVSRSDI
jgi:hypothetical protein